MKELTKQEKRKRAITIFTVMFKVGFFTWGGGWSIIAQLQKEFVEKRGWIEDKELTDMVAVCRSMPGIMIMNTSVMFGYHVGGFPCVWASLLGIALPPILVLCGVTTIYASFRDNPYVARTLVGIRASVIPIIGGAALKMTKTALVDKITWGIMAAACLFCIFTDLHAIFMVFGAGILGYLIKGAKRHGTVS